MSEFKLVEEALKNDDKETVISEVYKLGHQNLGVLMGKIMGYTGAELEKFEPLIEHSFIKVSLHCNWTENLVDLWNKMSKGNYAWNKILLVKEKEKAKYHVVINSTSEELDPSKTIVFRMEPHMEEHPEIWGAWSEPQNFLRVFRHENSINNLEWHLSKSYTELKTEKIRKNPELTGVISTVLSKKYHDPGHKKRVDFAKFLDSKEDITLHVYGDNLGYKHYKGSPPYHSKDKALLPYNYHFNMENQFIPNYFTEKIVDALLSESLIFYHGCRNIKDYIDERAFVWLELEDFEADYELIKKVISEDWRTLRLPYIRKEKAKLLDHLQFFPRLEKIILEIENDEENK